MDLGLALRASADAAKPGGGGGGPGVAFADNRATVKLAALRVYPLKSARESAGVSFVNHRGFKTAAGSLEHQEPKAKISEF